MWISGVDIPEELVRAARSGSLVLFVGAGASRDAPASLPSFTGLTTQIADEAGVPQLDAESSDVFLGRLDDSRVDVHERVRAHLDPPGSRPNALHKAIFELALATPVPRIVTTNYDTHLSRVVKARRLRWADYLAPALPMGDDFEGIVYLHGSLRQKARHLIVTDKDFGRAYLRDAWAARFLERRFSSFTVLFIGYSHDDVVMRYLARSLGRKSGRYVLTSDPDASKWRPLGIEPIPYEVRTASHAALTRAISGWAGLLSMGLLDHRQQIARLVAASPSSIPEEESYLSSVIGDEQLVQLFTDLARDEAWLRWAVAQPQCRSIFDPTAPWTTVSAALAFWFAERCLTDSALSDVGLSILAGEGGRMSGALWNAVGQRLHTGGSPRQGWLGPWVVALLECAPPDGRDWLEYALAASRLPDDRDAALLLFDHLTEPHVVLRPSFGLGPGARIDIGIRGDDHWLGESWERVLKPGLPSIVHDVLAISDRSLRRAHQLLVAAGQARQGWDPVSFQRSSIAPHTQDRHGERIGHLIDAARDSLEFLINTDSSSARAAIDAWSASDVPILRRLAVHGVTVDSGRTGTDKLTWLLDRGWLFDHQLKHEVFELLAAGLPSAAESAVDRVVAEAAKGPEGDRGDDVGAYETFNALVWLDRHSTAPSVSAALDRMRDEHPDFAPRDHPDFDKWSEGGFVGHPAPMAAEAFHGLLKGDRAAALEKLDEFKRARPQLGGSRVEDVVEFVRTVVADNPEDGLVFLSRDDDLDEDLIRGTLSGWSSGELGDDLARRAADRISLLDLDHWGEEIAPLIGRYAGAEGRTKWYRFKVVRDLARAIARQLPDAPVTGEASNWLERAINNTGGWLAEFWLHAVSYDWNSARDDWTGLGEESRNAIEELLRRGDLHGAIAEVIIASQLHFFFAADREWCRANVLPLLAWDEPERARRTWDGFLSWGRSTDPLLDAGLLRDYLDTTAHVGLFEDEMRRQLAQHLAAVALYSEIDPMSWVTEFTRLAPDGFRVDWVNQVGWTLGQLDPDVCVRQWRRWMRAYWERRVASLPVRLTFEEASALAEWVEYLGDATAEAVDLAVAVPAGLAPHGRLLHKTRDGVARAPAAYARLLGHLLSNTDRPFWGCDDLNAIVTELRGRADDTDIRRLLEQALRLGCRGAAEW